MLIVLLPAYNEERDIGALLDRIGAVMANLKLEYHVLVVNDGSQDGTVGEVQKRAGRMPVELLDHGVNKGLGQAMLTGFSRAVQLMKEKDVLVSMDSDNTHDPALIEVMLARVEQGADLVIASRYERGGEEVGLSRLRSFLSRGASILLGMFFPIPGARDYTCGYRAYRGSVLLKAFQQYGDRLVEERGFTCMAEILIKLSKLPVKVAEVPLVLRYDLKSGPSKMKVLRTILRYAVLIRNNL